MGRCGYWKASEASDWVLRRTQLRSSTDMLCAAHLWQCLPVPSISCPSPKHHTPTKHKHMDTMRVSVNRLNRHVGSQARPAAQRAAAPPASTLGPPYHPDTHTHIQHTHIQTRAHTHIHIHAHSLIREHRRKHHQHARVWSNSVDRTSNERHCLERSFMCHAYRWPVGNTGPYTRDCSFTCTRSSQLGAHADAGQPIRAPPHLLRTS